MTMFCPGFDDSSRRPTWSPFHNLGTSTRDSSAYQVNLDERLVDVSGNLDE